MSKRLNILLLVAGILAVGLNAYRAFHKNWNYGDPLDYRALYIGGKLYQNHQVQYNDSLGAEVWRSLKSAENFTSTTDFGDTYSSVSLYPPQAYVPFMALSFLPWKLARWVWWTLCALSLILVYLLLYRYKPKVALIVFAGGLSASYFALSLGQPVLPVLAMLFMAIYLKDKHAILSGILLGLAMMKFTAAIPFALWFLAQRKYRILLVGALTSIVLFLPMLFQDPLIIERWLTKTNAYYALLYQPGDFNIYTFSDSELSMMLDYFLSWDITVWKKVNAIGQLVGFGLMIWAYIKKLISPAQLLLGLLLVSFVFTYHLVYDAVLFIIPLALLGYKKPWFILVAFLWVISLPVNALAGDMVWLKFNYAILCAFGLVLFIFALILPKIVKRISISPAS